jgi:uncharacterized membrane protein
MESQIKLFGHAAHPMLVTLPLGLLSTAFVFDLVGAVGQRPSFHTVAFWNIAAGVLVALAAAFFGLVDWLAVPGHTRAKAVGAWHGGGNLVAVLIFLASWLARLGHVQSPGPGPIALAVIGAVLMGVTGWLGGELVERLRIGVDDGANVEAPSSLRSTIADPMVGRRRGEMRPHGA